MPWSQKQVRLANAVRHGFKPTGKAKGFTMSLADIIAQEEKSGKYRKRQKRA